MVRFLPMGMVARSACSWLVGTHTNAMLGEGVTVIGEAPGRLPYYVPNSFDQIEERQHDRKNNRLHRL